MNESKRLLNSVLSTVQMGQIGIRCVLNTAVRTDLRQALKDQLNEYDSIETQAHAIAASRGWELREADPAARTAANLMVKFRMAYGRSDSKVAAMMIQGNTRGMILGLKDLHRCSRSDPQIKTLSQKLLDCENANIRQMQGFL